MSDNNDVRKSFIVDEVDFGKDFAEKLEERIIEYAKINKAGDLLIMVSGLSPNDKLKLLLSARFIAHNIDKNIPETVSLSDAGKLLTNESKEAIGSRMSHLVKPLGFARKKSRGVYTVQPYKIEEFLDGLNLRGKTEHGKQPTRRKKQTGGGAIKHSGVGKDILELVENNFFDTPKTVKEVEDKLKEEIKFHDIRVIDTTIRKTFVKSKKLLKRIKNTGGGKAKWLYVTRK